MGTPLGMISRDASILGSSSGGALWVCVASQVANLTNDLKVASQIKHIGFISTRIAGTDGVSLEIQKWADVMESLGLTCFYFAGELDRPRAIGKARLSIGAVGIPLHRGSHRHLIRLLRGK